MERFTADAARQISDGASPENAIIPFIREIEAGIKREATKGYKEFIWVISDKISLHFYELCDYFEESGYHVYHSWDNWINEDVLVISWYSDEEYEKVKKCERWKSKQFSV